MTKKINNPSQIVKFVKGRDFPASKQEVIDQAKQNGADDNVIGTLQNLPFETFNSPNDIVEAYGQVND